MLFENRSHAGQNLAKRLESMPLKDPIIIALPRGGVPIGFEIAKRLNAPLEVLIVRKIGAPFRPEYGIGAITESGYYWIDPESAEAIGASEAEIETTLTKEHREVDRRVTQYRGDRPLPRLSGRTVVVVDDGLATGVTATVACHYLIEQGAEQIVLAAPVCSPSTASFLRHEVDQVICLNEPEYFFSVGQFYEDFTQTTDQEVIDLLSQAQAWKKDDETVSIPIPGKKEVALSGIFTVPASSQGVVIFAHGSGSGRLSPRNLQVAETLNQAGFATLLFDLLTPVESQNRTNVFDIPLLASRLVHATRWVQDQKSTKDLPIGYFGASTGGAAALWAAAELKHEISAVVSRGGRPDLAHSHLPGVSAPALLIVGGRDEPVIAMNEQAMKRLPRSKLTIIPEATHVFEEPGKLEAVAEEAVAWFETYLHAKVDATPGLRRAYYPLALAIRKKANPIREVKDLKPLIDELSQSRIVMLGESSHGTHEFYEWRRMISEWLIVKHGFNFIAVEGDWPACWELNRSIHSESKEETHEVLRGFSRWPTWMWANNEIVRLADWMRTHNRSNKNKAGFFGLDVYSLFESIDVVLRQVEKTDPFLAQRMKNRYACFQPFQRDERAYVKSLVKLPTGCAHEVNENLRDILKLRLGEIKGQDDALFNAEQNARIVANAERYYRTMIHADEDSWNVRDRHMTDTLEILLNRYGKESKAIVWAHNTHIGDYRATDMAKHGQVNIGGLAREKWGTEKVALVGFGTYQGEVTASSAWDGPIKKITIPPGRPGSYEAAFHEVAKSIGPNYYISLREDGPPKGPLTEVRGHRAIGVVYQPKHERFGNYVPTSLANRYDAFIYVDKTTALEPLIQPFESKEIPETWPLGQ